MELPLKFNTVESRWSVVFIKTLQVVISKKKSLSLKIDYVLANIADSDEMPHFIWVFIVKVPI